MTFYIAYLIINGAMEFALQQLIINLILLVFSKKHNQEVRTSSSQVVERGVENRARLCIRIHAGAWGYCYDEP